MGIKRRKVGPVLSAREVAFIKHSTLRDNNLLCSWIVELPALVTSWIANEDRLLHVRTQRSVRFSFVCDAITSLLHTRSPIYPKDIPYYFRIYPYFPLFSIPCFLPVAVELYSL